MNVIVSFINTKTLIADPNRLLGIFNTDTKQLIQWINLDKISGIEDVTHATGMCYFNDILCVGLIPKTHRLTSKLLIINLKTGIKNITPLYFTKAIHGICPLSLNSNILLTASSQTDLVTALTIFGEKIVVEDIYYDFLQANRELVDLTQEYIYDDNLHINDVLVHKDKLWVSMFHNYTEKPTCVFSKQDKIAKPKPRKDGLIINMDLSNNTLKFYNPKIILNDQFLPHTIYFDSENKFCYCNSGQSEFYYDWKKISLQGFTRGICEDKAKGGFWIGISSYRQDNTSTLNIAKDNDNFPGAMLQFVDKKTLTVTDTFKMFDYGKEIFEVLPYDMDSKI